MGWWSRVLESLLFHTKPPTPTPRPAPAHAPLLGLKFQMSSFQKDGEGRKTSSLSRIMILTMIIIIHQFMERFLYASNTLVACIVSTVPGDGKNPILKMRKLSSGEG